MPIRIIDRMLKEAVTYWPPKLTANGVVVTDENQQVVYQKAVRVLCFWIDRVEEFLSGRGEQRVSRSVVFVGRDVHYQGLLFRSPLNALTKAQRNDPRQELPTVELVQRFDKIPTLKYDQFVRKAYI